MRQISDKFLFQRHVLSLRDVIFAYRNPIRYGQKIRRIATHVGHHQQAERATKYVPREELENYVTLRMEERDGTPVDIRTLQRDFNEIETLFGIRICFDKKRNGYHINEEDDLKKEQYERLLLNFDLLNAIDSTSNLHTFVLAD